MEIKTAMRYQCIPFKMANTHTHKTVPSPNAIADVEKLDHSYIAGRDTKQ